MNQFEIVAVKRDSKGKLTDFKLNNGQELNYQEAIEMVDENQIKGVNIIHRKDKQILRSIPDGSPGNNFDNLPIF